MTSLRQRVSGIGSRQVRIFCGLILFAYLLSHFANHALGNLSFDAMEQGLDYHMQFWRDPWVVPVFYGAAITHWALGLWALYARREFRYPAREITQLVLGLSIPALIAIHLVGVRLQVPLFDRHFSYAQSLWGYWVARPNAHWLQYTLLLVAWTHGCIGLYFWLRLNRWFRAAAPYLLAAAVLIPTLALLGLAQGAREVIALSADPKWQATYVAAAKLPTPAQAALLEAIIHWFWIGYAMLIALIFVARAVRNWHEHRGGTIALSYPDGRVVRVPKGLSVLEASLRHKVPHASVCGGRARCSTCRIRVLGDTAELPAPSHRESFVLERVGASADPAIRLACQLRPDSDVAFHLLFPTDTSATSMHRAALRSIGEERYLVCMFVDIRRSTGLAEKRLPFDTMFLINRFVAAVARAVEESGGQPNQFLGDGVLALFGLSVPPEVACRQALAAIGRIAQNVDALNRDLAADLREPIRFGIGVNGGDVVIGDIGYKDRIVFTALGDAVNVAARLQDLTKEHDCEALIAEDVCRRAGVSAEALSSRVVAIRGRSDRLQVCAAPEAASFGRLMAPT